MYAPAESPPDGTGLDATGLDTTGFSATGLDGAGLETGFGRERDELGELTPFTTLFPLESAKRDANKIWITNM